VSRNRPAAPAHRDRGLSWRALELVCLDFEATGLDFARDTIVSFGVVRIRDGRIDVGDSAYELVDPGDVAPSPVSVTVHGLRPVDLRGAQGLDAARASLGALIAGRFIVTWAGHVEAGFLNVLYGGGARRWRRRCVDARELMFALVDEPEPPFTLTSVAEGLGVPVASAHHALDDALVTAQVFLIAAARLEARGVRTIRELQRTKRPESPALRRPRAPIGR
jgi:DNA polymerase-3 subunit epsilon